MKKKPVSKAILEIMIKQLTELEEQKTIVLDQYYAEPSSRRANFENMLAKYKVHLDTYIKNAIVLDGISSDCPFVLIGSHVEVLDMEENESYTFRVVSPLIDETTSKVDCVSYLSPIGRALLSKEVNDVFQIETPSQLLNYKVSGIWLMDA